MQLTLGTLSFTFRVSPTGRYVAPITLPEWEPFRSANTIPGREGQHVLLEVPPVYDELEEGKLLAPSAYMRSLEYFFDHRLAIQQSTLAACLTFVQQLQAVNEHYSAGSPELAHVAKEEDLHTLIDLSYVRLFPYHLGGLPYIGLSFEANWYEYGYLALLVGSEVLASGFPGTARAVDLSIRDDGGVI